MLLILANILQNYIHQFSVLHYITLRSILAALSGLSITLILGPTVINYLTTRQIGQMVREVGPQSHYVKKGTPTMGGVLIIIAVIASVLLCADLSNRFIWMLLFTLVAFGGIGWVDDYKKLILKSSRGISAKQKYLWQSLFSLVLIAFVYFNAKSVSETSLYLPFFKNFVLPLGIFYFIWGYFVIVGTSNAVNLTDGLDGLAILPVVMISGALGIFAYVTGNLKFAEYLVIPYIAGTGEIAIFCAAIVGAGLGFLWFNAYPALVFMGDVGALGLGAALGAIALLIRQELVLFIMGGVFVLETISVILQVGSYKLRGKRIFKMAPIHHHFELAGWPEPRVIVRFWIITVVLVLLGLSTLKLR